MKHCHMASKLTLLLHIARHWIQVYIVLKSMLIYVTEFKMWSIYNKDNNNSLLNGSEIMLSIEIEEVI